jgi:hypothetical protein
MWKRIAGIGLCALSHAIEPPPTTTYPVIVTEQHLNATLPPVPLNEFANDHMVDAENDRSSTITAQQIVDKIWTRENADGSTHTIAPPEQIDPLAAPDLSMPSASGAADSTDAANEGFDVSDLSLYDQALSTNRGAVEQHATTQEQIGVRLNSTMALLAPLRQTLKQLKATELQYKKELQILKLQAKHDIIVAEKSKLKQEKQERLDEEKRLEDMKKMHEKHLATIKAHLATLNGELETTDEAESEEEKDGVGMEETSGEHHPGLAADEAGVGSGGQSAADEAMDAEEEDNETDLAIKQAQQESSKDELIATEDGGAGADATTGSNMDTKAATDIQPEIPEPDEDGDGTPMEEEAAMEQEDTAEEKKEEEAKTSIEKEVDMDKENKKVEQDETDVDDKLLDNISRNSEEVREDLANKNSENEDARLKEEEEALENDIAKAAMKE